MCDPSCYETCRFGNGMSCEMISHPCTDLDQWEPNETYLQQHPEVLALAQRAERNRAGWMQAALALSENAGFGIKMPTEEQIRAILRLHHMEGLFSSRRIFRIALDWILRSARELPVRRLIDLNAFDLVAHLHRQEEFSVRTFGPGERTRGILDHLIKELVEVQRNPEDVTEWIDIVILAFDGALRIGHAPEEIVVALASKQTKNEGRRWPDWRTAEPGKAIEHLRDEEPTS